MPKSQSASLPAQNYLCSAYPCVVRGFSIRADPGSTGRRNSGGCCVPNTSSNASARIVRGFHQQAGGKDRLGWLEGFRTRSCGSGSATCGTR